MHGDGRITHRWEEKSTKDNDYDETDESSFQRQGGV